MTYENPKAGETVYLPVFTTSFDGEFLLLTPAMVSQSEEGARKIGEESLRAIKSLVAESCKYSGAVREYVVQEGGAIDQTSVAFPVNGHIKLISGPLFDMVSAADDDAGQKGSPAGHTIH